MKFDLIYSVKRFFIALHIKIIFNQYIFILTTIILVSCNPSEERTPIIETTLSKNIDIQDSVIPEVKEPEIHYSFLSRKDWLDLKDSLKEIGAVEIIAALNRTDELHLNNFDSILLPDQYNLDFNEYLSFPNEAEILRPVDKIIIFSNPFQIFAAYENGKLVLQGQTNTGTRRSPTPPRLYFTNWKAKRSVSTVNGSWILNWNFNISNFEGIGFHQYGLPGYPASHSCLRLTNEDAYFLYNWADQWILNGNQLAVNGTPVIVYGQYDFDAEKPWNKLAENPNALRYNQDSLNNIVSPHLEAILISQNKRKEFLAPFKIQ